MKVSRLHSDLYRPTQMFCGCLMRNGRTSNWAAIGRALAKSIVDAVES